MHRVGQGRPVLSAYGGHGRPARLPAGGHQLRGARRRGRRGGRAACGRPAGDGDRTGRGAGRLAEGAWLVELAAVHDGTLVPAAVGAAAGVRLDPALTVTESLTA